MRRFLLTILTSVIFLLYLSAQTERSVSLSFSPEEFSLTEEGDLTRITTSAYNMVLKSDTLSPCLPYVCVYVLIGPDEEYVSSSVQASRTVFQDNVRLAPNPLPVPTDCISDSPSLPGVHFNESSYPDSNVEYTGTHTINGFRVLSFLVCPFAYDNNRSKLFLCNQMDLGLQLGYDKDKRKETSVTTNADMINKIKEYVVNPEHMKWLYPDCAQSQRTIQDRNSTDSCRYLIITRDSLKDEFQTLADWKTSKGVKTKVITLESIYTNYTDTTNAMKIKHFISDYYEASREELEYVLLAGSYLIFPVQKCHSEISFQGNVERVEAPSDMFFSCIGTLNWDKNGNGKHGEIADSVDLTPYLNVSRLPVTTKREASMIVDKILRYEIFPDTLCWNDTILMCAAEYDFVPSDTLPISYFHYSSEQIYSQYIEGTSWAGAKYRFYDTGTDNPLGALYNVTKDNLQYELMRPYPFVNVNAHGMNTFWSLENNSFYQFLDAEDLYNPSYTLITTIACHTADFGSSPTLAESFLLNPNSGVIGYYGCSHYGIGYRGYFLSPSDNYVGTMYRNLFTSSRNIGEAVKEAKLGFLASCNTYSDSRWLHLFMNPLCDPETPVYASTPRFFSHLDVAHYNGNFTIHNSDDNRYNCCVMSRNDGGTSKYSFYANCVGDLSLTGLYDEYSICLTSTDFIPCRIIAGPTVYLQNEQMRYGSKIYADHVYIGSQVTSGRETGSVTIDEGEYEINSRYGVTIESDFEIKIGASLEILTNQPITP